jgi:hypothetical protein
MARLLIKKLNKFDAFNDVVLNEFDPRFYKDNNKVR